VGVLLQQLVLFFIIFPLILAWRHKWGWVMERGLSWKHPRIKIDRAKCNTLKFHH
jgi:hypothetical protein